MIPTLGAGHFGPLQTGLTAQPRDTTIESQNFALSIAQLIRDKQGEDLAILDVSGPLVIADYFVIATARNTRQALAIARELDAAVKRGPLHDAGLTRLNVAGMEGEGNWILLDLDLVVVHIFTAETRALYDLENLWADAPRVGLTPQGPTVAAQEAKGTASDDDWGSSRSSL
ncbi:MAG: ribosome silencing factor [Planctomycetota bacterium]